MKKTLTRKVENPYITGDSSNIIGDATNIKGNATNITGDLDECEITEEDCKNKIDINTLVK